MFMLLFQHVKISLKLLLITTVFTGILYPLLVTMVGQQIFPWRANGSFVTKNNRLVGSLLIGQDFSSDQYFWGRPSATTGTPYNALASSGSNLAQSNPLFFIQIKDRVLRLQKAHPQSYKQIPVDLVTTSASGLDPEVSPASAFYQVSRVAAARQLPEKTVTELVARLVHHRTLGVLGEPRVNVLALNLALDRLAVSQEQ